MVLYEPLYKPEEAAQILRTTVESVWEMLNEDLLPFVMIREERFIRGIDLEGFINNLNAI